GLAEEGDAFGAQPLAKQRQVAQSHLDRLVEGPGRARGCLAKILIAELDGPMAAELPSAEEFVSAALLLAAREGFAGVVLERLCLPCADPDVRAPVATLGLRGKRHRCGEQQAENDCDRLRVFIHVTCP